MEIGSEELPATFVPTGSANLEKSLRALLEKEEIPFDRIETYGTPRRLAVYVHQLAKGKPSQAIEKKGPSLEQAYTQQGQIKPAAEGFFRSLRISVPTLEAIRNRQIPSVEIRSVKGIDYLFGTIYHEGRATAAILAEQLPNLILKSRLSQKDALG